MSRDKEITEYSPITPKPTGTGRAFRLKNRLIDEMLNISVSKEYLFEYFGRLHYQMATDIKFVMFKTHSFSENYTEGLHIKINPKDYCKKCGKKLSNVNFNGIEKTIGICMEHLR